MRNVFPFPLSPAKWIGDLFDLYESQNKNFNFGTKKTLILYARSIFFQGGSPNKNMEEKNTFLEDPVEVMSFDGTWLLWLVTDVGAALLLGGGLLPQHLPLLHGRLSGDGQVSKDVKCDQMTVNHSLVTVHIRVSRNGAVIQVGNLLMQPVRKNPRLLNRGWSVVGKPFLREDPCTCVRRFYCSRIFLELVQSYQIFKIFDMCEQDIICLSVWGSLGVSPAGQI